MTTIFIWSPLHWIPSPLRSIGVLRAEDCRSSTTSASFFGSSASTRQPPPSRFQRGVSRLAPYGALRPCCSFEAGRPRASAGSSRRALGPERRRSRDSLRPARHLPVRDRGHLLLRGGRGARVGQSTLQRSGPIGAHRPLASTLRRAASSRRGGLRLGTRGNDLSWAGRLSADPVPA